MGLRNYPLVKFVKAHRTFGDLEILYKVVGRLAQEARDQEAAEKERAAKVKAAEPVKVERDEQGTPIKTYQQRKLEAAQIDYQRFTAAYTKPDKQPKRGRQLSKGVRVSEMQGELPGFDA